MKKMIEYILKYTCRITSIVFPYSFVIRFKSFRTKLYTYWIYSEFKKFGEASSIGYPIYLKGGRYISIGTRTGIGLRGILTAWDNYKGDLFNPTITIGDNTSIGEDSHITAINKIKIGNNVLIGKKVTITDNGHGKATADFLVLAPLERSLYSKGPVVIEDGVWIGDKVTILPGIRIGKNSIIGANALITKNIPANCVAGGVPATVIKYIEL